MKGLFVFVLSALFFFLMINFALKILICTSAIVVFITLCLSFSKNKCKIMIIPLIVIFFSIFTLSLGKDEVSHYNNTIANVIYSNNNDINVLFDKDRIVIESAYIPNTNIDTVLIEFISTDDFQKTMGVVYVEKDSPIRKIIIPNNSVNYDSIINILSKEEYLINLVKKNETKIIFKMNRKF